MSLRKVGLPVPRHNGTCRRYRFHIGSTTELLIASVLLDVVKAIGCLSQILSFDSIPIRSRASKDIRFSTRLFLVPKMEISKSQLVFSPPSESPHKPPCSQTSYDGFVSRLLCRSSGSISTHDGPFLGQIASISTPQNRGS